MSGVVVSNPIRASKVEAWRRFCQELAGARRRSYEASRRRMGITRERLGLVETTFGSAAITAIDAPDLGQALGEIMTSNHPFDRWYRGRIQDLQGVQQVSYGLHSEQPPLTEGQELLFEWTGDPGSDMKAGGGK